MTVNENLFHLCSVLVQDIAFEQEIPIMETFFVLQIPNILIAPSIDELQHYFGKVITTIIETHKSVITWGQRYFSTNTSTDELGNLNIMHKLIIDN